MDTDPKKTDEIKDEELEKVSGGAEGGQIDELPEDGDGPIQPQGLPKPEKI